VKRVLQALPLIGPALVAGVAYLDPGNVASNMTAGARYGYLLVWVVVSANLVAWLVQYLSAKLGLASGKSLTEHIGERLHSRWVRLAFWAQAELAAMATYVAEIIGGAIALNLLFGLPLLLGGLITAGVSLAILSLHNRVSLRSFEWAIIALLAIIAVGFLAALFVRAPDWGDVAGGLVPQFAGTDSVLLAASIVGATVMPHAIYAHSALMRDRFAHIPRQERSHALFSTRIDVTIALFTAGVINLAMLIIGAVTLTPLVNGMDASETPSLNDIYAALGSALGPAIAVLFAIALLASGLASSSVASYAGADIMHGLIRRNIPLWLRRTIPAVPAIILLGIGANPVWMLVLSQVVLSFAIPLALVPLIRLTSEFKTMGDLTNTRLTTIAAVVVAVLLVALNGWLIVLLVAGG
jgi:manganese transport protein